MNRPPRRALLAAAAAIALAIAPAASATAASRDGWVRLAHLSPDTAAVNVTLSSLSGDVVLFRLNDVAYGAVSKYMRLPAGTYALAMVPAGSTDPDAKPVVSGSVEVTAGEADTVAAIGLNKDLQTKAIEDDLAAAGGDRAKVRVVQASVTHDSVDVEAGSTSVASGATFGEVGKYTAVPAGSTKLTLSSGSDTADVTEDFAAGSAHTLFVIDDAKGGLTVSPALDSSSSTETPVGSLAAGGGGLAEGDAGTAALLAGGAAAAALVVGGVMVRRRSAVLRG